MRILHILGFGYEVGGEERSVRALVDQLRATGHDVCVAASDRARPGHDAFFDRTLPAITGGPVTRLAGHAWSPGVHAAVRRLVADYRPDVVHLHSPSDFSASQFWAVRPTPAVLTVHGPEDFTLGLLGWKLDADCYRNRTYDPADLTAAGRLRLAHLRWVQRPVLRLGLRHVDTVIAPSRFLAEQLGADVDPRRIATIPYGLPPAEPGPTPPAPDGGDPTILFVGRIERVKGLDVAVRALPGVVAAVPRARLVVVGEGADTERVARLAADLGVAERIEWCGWLRGADLRARYRAATVSVVPSRWPEVFGLVAIEAMGAGRPVVVSRVGGLAEVVDDGVTGTVVDPGDPDALAAALVAILTDPPQAARLGAAGRLVAASGHRVDEFADQVTAVYRAAIARHSATRPTGTARPAGAARLPGAGR